MAMEVQPEDRGTTVMERVRAVHLRMVDAVLSGDGLEGVATIRKCTALTRSITVVPRSSGWTSIATFNTPPSIRGAAVVGRPAKSAYG